jgi:type IV pilus assembly protein PilM
MALKDLIQTFVGRTGATMGLDIGHASVKGVHIEKAGSGFRLVQAEVEPILDIGDEEEVGRDSTVDAVGRLAKQMRLGKDKVVTSVSGESVIVRPIPVPVLDKKQDFALTVESEARDFIPFDLRDVIMDYQRLRQMELPSGKGEEVLVVAARRELINNHLEMLERANVDVGIIDVAGIALVNALLMGCDLDDDETVALVNIGSDVTNIAIVRSGTTRFTRDLNVAGRNITRSIASELRVDPSRAEELKSTYGLQALFEDVIEPVEMDDEMPDEAGDEDESSIVSEVYRAIDALQGTEPEDPELPEEPVATGDASSVASACEQVLSDIASELKRSLLYYENQMDGDSTDRILIAGGSALLPGMAKFFEENLEIPARIMQPFERIQCDLSDEEREHLGPILATGIGLALRCAA